MDRGSNARLGPWAGACAAAVGLGTSLVASAGDALFLHRVGPEHLGTAFAVSSALLVVILGAVGVRADRGGRERLLLVIGLIGAVGLAAADLMIAVAPRPAAAAILIGGKQVSAAMELAFWVLIAERFDARQIRRAAIGLIAANGAGRAVGAFAVPLAVPAVGTPALIGAGAVAFAIAGMLAPKIASTGALRPLPTAAVPASRSPLGVIHGAEAVRSSPVARRLFWLVLLGGAFAPILYYLLGFRAAGAFGDEAELASFLGLFWGGVSVLALISQVLIAPRVLARAGVATALAVAPVIAAAGAIAVLVDSGLAVVVLAQALVKVLDAAVDNPAHRLAQNLTPREIRGRIGGFLDGVAKRVGAIVGGVLAALLAAPVLAMVAAGIGAGWTAVALVFRRRFPDLAVAELARRAREPEIGSGESLEALDARSRRRLHRGLLAGGEEANRAIDLLVELDERVLDAARELARGLAAGPAEPGPIRAALVARIDRGARPSIDREWLEALAGSSDPADRVVAARLAGPDSPVCVELEGDDDESVRAAAAAVARRGDPAALVELGDPAALRELAASAGSIDSADQLVAGRALLAAVREGGDLAAAAAAGLAALVRERDDAPTAEWILFRSGLEGAASRLFDRASAIPLARGAALELWALVATDDISPVLADQLGHRDRPIARAAERGLRSLGSAAIDALLRTASFGRRRSRRPALELLRELRVPEGELDALIESEIDQVAHSAARLAGLARLAGGDVLIRRVLERIDESAFTLFTLVEARTGQRAVGAAARRLRYARHRAARARALEALDAALPRRFSPLIGALEPSGLPDRARAGALVAKSKPDGPTEAIRGELGGADRLARQLAIYALGDRGRSALRDDITEAARRALDEVDPDELLSRLRGSLDPRNGDNGTDEMPRSVESVMVLSGVPLFADLSTRELAELAEVVTWVSAKPGEVLCTEGEVGEAMYFVLTGEVRVERDANGESTERVATLGPGEPFGEMALFDDEVRSATVVAETASRIGKIDRVAFEEIVGEVPGIALGICRVLSRRVRDVGDSE